MLPASHSQTITTLEKSNNNLTPLESRDPLPMEKILYLEKIIFSGLKNVAIPSEKSFKMKNVYLVAYDKTTAEAIFQFIMEPGSTKRNYFYRTSGSLFGNILEDKENKDSVTFKFIEEIKNHLLHETQISLKSSPISMKKWKVLPDDKKEEWKKKFFIKDFFFLSNYFVGAIINFESSQYSPEVLSEAVNFLKKIDI
jgi:hypothetical protein